MPRKSVVAATPATPVPDTDPVGAPVPEAAPVPKAAPKAAPVAAKSEPQVVRKAYKGTSGIRCGRTGKHIMPGGTVYLSDAEAKPIMGVLTQVKG